MYIIKDMETNKIIGYAADFMEAKKALYHGRFITKSSIPPNERSIWKWLKGLTNDQFNEYFHDVCSITRED